MPAAAKIFLSTVSDEFRAYRDQLRSDLTRPNVDVKVQQDFRDQGHSALDALDVYIAGCDGVVHLAGDMTGSVPGEPTLSALRAKHPDFADRLPLLGEALQSGAGVSYTQWEAWLALYHGKLLFIAKAADSAERGPKYLADDASRAAQAAHLQRLKAMDRRPGCVFVSPDNLAKYVLSSPILDLLAKAEVVAYAEQLARAGDVAQGFIDEMARKVAGDKALDFEGKKTGGAQRHRDLRKRDRRTAVGDQFRRHCRNGSDQGAGSGRQGPVGLRPRHSRQGGPGHGARGEEAPRTLRRQRNRAPPSRTRHRACGL